MNIIILVIFALISGLSLGYMLGLLRLRYLVTEKAFENLVDKAIIPIGIIENINDTLYLYEKDTTNFLCQGSSVEELSLNLLANRKINVAFVMFPTENKNQTYWFVNGKLLVANLK